MEAHSSVAAALKALGETRGGAEACAHPRRRPCVRVVWRDHLPRAATKRLCALLV